MLSDVNQSKIRTKIVVAVAKGGFLTPEMVKETSVRGNKSVDELDMRIIVSKVPNVENVKP